MLDIIPQRNGFVHTVVEAYNQHRALIVRPDDVWLAIHIIDESLREWIM